jgi:hypothetical protein
METGKPAVTAGDAFNLGCEIAVMVNCPHMKRPDFDFGPSLVELKNERRRLIARSLATDQEWSTQSIRINRQQGAVAHPRRPRWVMERMAIEVRRDNGARPVEPHSHPILAWCRIGVPPARKVEKSSEHWPGTVL